MTSEEKKKFALEFEKMAEVARGSNEEIAILGYIAALSDCASKARKISEQLGAQGKQREAQLMKDFADDLSASADRKKAPLLARAAELATVRAARNKGVN